MFEERSGRTGVMVTTHPRPTFPTGETRIDGQPLGLKPAAC